MSGFVQASKKRVFFALVLDYFFLSSTLQLCGSLFLPEAYGIDEFGVNFLICCMLELIILRVFGRNVGAWFLGLYQSNIVNEKGKAKTVYVVEADIRIRENWLTMFLAYFCFSSGCKSLYYWTIYPVDFPIFGFYLKTFPTAVYNIFSAGLCFATAFFIYRVSKKAIFWAFSATFFQIASIWQSRHLIDDAMAEAVTYRRSLTGRETGAEELEFIKSIFPEGYFLIAGLFLIVFLSQAWRFR